MVQSVSYFLTLLLLAGGGFVAAFGLLVWAVGWHRPWLLWLAAACLLLSIGGLAGGAYRAVGYLRSALRGRTGQKVYEGFCSALRGRTGQEVYEGFFGRSPAGCVRVTKYQDAVVPVMDMTVWLHFRTCPAELRRIIRRRARFPTNSTSRESYPLGIPDDIRAACPLLGFRVVEPRRSSFLVLSRDSTEGYFEDMLL